ncbi:MAG: hypothetical protein GX653_01165 [Clostridiales bacterium]|nr:hypothetical protein [Clostridiales bacterium]
MFKKTIALLLTGMLALSGVAALAQETPAQVPVLATFNGTEILKTEVDAILPQITNYITDATDYRQATEFVVQQHMLQQKIKDLQFDQFTPEEEASFKAEAQAQWNEGIESYVSYYLAEDTEEARAQLRQQAEEFYAGQNYTLEVLESNFRQRASIDRLTAHLVGDYQPKEEEVQAAFQQFGAAYQGNYENNIMAYEYNTYFNQQPSWYTPEGYRGIIHILLQPDPELMETYNRLQSTYEEQQSDQGSEQTAADPADQPAEPAAATPVPAEPVTQQMVDDARQAAINSRKADIDAILDRLSKGEAFENLIKEYGQDPGMQDEQNLANGYNVHRESVIWDPVFTAAAFSDKVQQVGDVSDPVLGTSGIHILKYLRDVPSGLIMTDAIRAEITDYLRATKENAAFTEALSTWQQEYTIVYNEEAIQAATDEAKAAEPADDQPEPEGLQAVPEGSESPEATEAPNGENPAG